jgi:hypothetical protein
MLIINTFLTSSSIFHIDGKIIRGKDLKFVNRILKRNLFFKVKSKCSTSTCYWRLPIPREPSYPFLFVNRSGSKTLIRYICVTVPSVSSKLKPSFAVVEVLYRKAYKSDISSRSETKSLAKAHTNRDQKPQSAGKVINYTIVRQPQPLGISHSKKEGQFTTEVFYFGTKNVGRSSVSSQLINYPENNFNRSKASKNEVEQPKKYH